MRMLGVDPGSLTTGYGVIDELARGPAYVAAGTIRTGASGGRAERLHRLHRQLSAVIEAARPDLLSLERNFVAANVQSALRLGEARGVVLLAAAQYGLGLFEYAPAEVKLTVAGNGGAGKQQVAFFVRRALGLEESLALAVDATDALAMALSHFYRSRSGLGAAWAQGRARAGRAAGVAGSLRR